MMMKRDSPQWQALLAKRRAHNNACCQWCNRPEGLLYIDEHDGYARIGEDETALNRPLYHLLLNCRDGTIEPLTITLVKLRQCSPTIDIDANGHVVTRGARVVQSVNRLVYDYTTKDHVLLCMACIKEHAIRINCQVKALR